MKVRPTIVTPSNPVGADSAIQELQVLLAEITLNGSPLFEGGLLVGLVEGSKEPKILWKGNDFYPLRPNDNFPIMAFFYETDPRVQIHNHNEFDFNLIVWFNQDKFYLGKSYRVKEYLINRIQNALDNDTLRVYTRDIFKAFDVKDVITAKFDGFRLNFKYQKEYECIISEMVEFEESEFYDVEFY